MNWRTLDFTRRGSRGLGARVTCAAPPAMTIRTLTILSRPQAAQPQEFQAVQLIAQEWRKLGLDINVQVMPWEQMSDLVWYQRDKWDITAWQMVGRPERARSRRAHLQSLPHQHGREWLQFRRLHQPRLRRDRRRRSARRSISTSGSALVFQAQEIIARDQPIIILVHPTLSFAYNKRSVGREDSVVDQAGIGIKNFWTFDRASRRSATRRTSSSIRPTTLQAINPLYISGGADTWITELVWDRLMRVGPDGLPKPWAAESLQVAVTAPRST